MGQGRPLIPQADQRRCVVQGPWQKYLKWIPANDRPAIVQIMAIFADYEKDGIPVTAESAEIALKLGRRRYRELSDERASEALKRQAQIEHDKALVRPFHDDPAGVVYYVRRADTIKIGTTKNFRSRMRGLMPDEILAAEPGSYSLEDQRHREFRTHRIGGHKSEYFRPAPGLLDLIQALRMKYGVPDQSLVRVSDGRRLFPELPVNAA